MQFYCAEVCAPDLPSGVRAGIQIPSWILYPQDLRRFGANPNSPLLLQPFPVIQLLHNLIDQDQKDDVDDRVKQAHR